MYKQKEKSKVRILNFAGQVLNLEGNSMESNASRIELIRIYNKILNKNETISKSFEKSEKFFKLAWDKNEPKEVLNELTNLKTNTQDSFLILPLSYAYHGTGAIVKKNDEGYLFTIVNKEQSTDSRNKAISYQVSNDKDSLKSFVENILSEKWENTEELNSKLNNISKKRYFPKIRINNQKENNCYLKNLEYTVKLAIATSNMNNKEYNLLMMGFKKEEYKPNIGMTNNQLHKKFILKLIVENPELKTDLENIFKRYIVNKTYKKYLKNGNDPLKALEKTSIELENLVPQLYCPKQKNEIIFEKQFLKPEIKAERKSQITEFMKYISKPMIIEFKNEITTLAYLSKDKELINKLEKFIKIISHEKELCRVLLNEPNTLIKKIEENIPVAAKTLRLDFSVLFIQAADILYKSGESKRALLMYDNALELCDTLPPVNIRRAKILKSIALEEGLKGNNEIMKICLLESFKSLNQAHILDPDTYPESYEMTNNGKVFDNKKKESIKKNFSAHEKSIEIASFSERQSGKKYSNPELKENASKLFKKMIKTNQIANRVKEI